MFRMREIQGAIQFLGKEFLIFYYIQQALTLIRRRKHRVIKIVRLIKIYFLSKFKNNRNNFGSIENNEQFSVRSR